MRVVVQRVSGASVSVLGLITGEIGHGLLVYLGIRAGDTAAQADKLACKVLQLRIFDDESSKMNRNLLDIAGELLVISQFTLYGDTAKGNRPSYSKAAKSEVAKPLYEYFIEVCRNRGVKVATGAFGSEMSVRLVNDGPVTLICAAENS